MFNPETINLNAQEEPKKKPDEIVQKISKMYEQMHQGKMTPEEIKQKFEPLLQAVEFKELLSKEQKEAMQKSMAQALQSQDQQQFITQMTSSIEPLLEIKKQNPQLFEDVQARIFAEMGGFIPLNKRISYGLGRDNAHIHLAPSHAVKEELPLLFLDGMHKLAEIIKKNEKIKEVTGTSWLMATKTYGEMMAKLGFEINDVPEEVKKEHFVGETRPMKRAVMDRKNFIKKFGQIETEKIKNRK
jgi:hypothetical protein